MRFDEHPFSDHPIKLMILGDSGAGKTGSLASLANAGYRLFILDFDNGTPVLRSYLTDEGAKRVYVKTFNDRLKMDGIAILPDGPPSSYSSAMKTLNKWDEGEEDLGTITKWGPQDICVIDSLTFFSRAAMRDGLYQNTKDDLMKGGKESISARYRWQHPYPADYGEAQNKVENFFALAYGSYVKCNLIVNAHIEYRGGGGKQAVKDKVTGETYIREVDSEQEGTAQPVTIGKKLSPFLRRYFNTVVMLDVEGSGSQAKHVIKTVSQERIPLKNELPTVLPPRITVSGGDPKSGLAKLFEVLRTGKG